MTTAEKIRQVRDELRAINASLEGITYREPTIGEVLRSCVGDGLVVKRQAVRSALRSRSGRRGPPRGKGVCEHCGAMPCDQREPVPT